jgi:hypothetical protein
MALLDEELMPFFGNPNIQRQGARARALAAQRDVNTLPDPRTYAAISGLLGQAPDEMGFSVLNPDYEGIQRVARPAFAVGTALGIAPLAGGASTSKAAMRAGRAGERMAERAVPRIMGQGGLPAEMLQAMAQGSRSNILAPKRYRGKPLEGLPEAVEVNGRMDPFGTDQRIVDIAGRYMSDKGITYQPQRIYAPLDVERATRLANAFEKMKHTPTDKKTQKAYKALAKETQDQYEALLKAGYKFDFIRGADPYGNPRNAINDVIANKRMSVFPTDQGFGGPSAAAVDISGNPLMARSDLRIANDPNTTYNDLFRAVHDVFGHAKHGVGFRARGEENAFQAHARMYSPEALPAAASETRGQNSWVNFGPYGKQNQTASPSATEYAAQKTGLLPRWAYEEGLLSDWLWPQGVYRGR